MELSSRIYGGQNMKEEWRDIKGYEGKYQISNLGRVKTLRRKVKSPALKNGYRFLSEKIHKPCDNGRGYKYACFRIDGGKVSHKYIHTMVAEAFLDRGPDHTEVNHIDANKSNNIASNLEWCTRKENMDHAIRLGLKITKKGSQVSQSKLTESNVLFIRSEYAKGNIRQIDLAKLFGVDDGTISNIIRRRKWKHI